MESKDFNRIWKFIAECEVFTLATSYQDQPYCTPCFYAFDEMDQLLIFKSSVETKHVQDLLKNPTVAGSILPKKLAIGQVKGIQFTGTAKPVQQGLCTDPLKLEQLYYSRFPIARTVDGELWFITLETVKLTDSKLGFGKKLNWSRVRKAKKEQYR
ncbi:MAG: pyridoxamine 5'-phosphate oxidase family protein [Flavobacteriales bacterium]|nr:pyridoxamine 5'-phosphate oxidase family protein [Flavobacteriales bacterium]MCB9185847.1 pyridoxamine 5'-phosphate oxidase family protein [Flavobacteriales bacterium]